jgi:hypothetical protein
VSQQIFSRWQPDTGGYEYLSAPGSQNINDDLPSPELNPATKIGVPSIEAGRPLPAGATVIGEGDEAVGIIAPVDPELIVRRTRSLAGLGDGMASSTVLWGAAAVAGVALLWYVSRKR